MSRAPRHPGDCAIVGKPSVSSLTQINVRAALNNLHREVTQFIKWLNDTEPDRSRINKACTYVWRLWTLPELRELLLEASFARVGIYWEGTDKDGEGNGEYTLTEHGEADPCYVIYIVAEK